MENHDANTDTNTDANTDANTDTSTQDNGFDEGDKVSYGSLLVTGNNDDKFESLDDKKSAVPEGDEDLYMLKSQMVPPVCPACPEVRKLVLEKNSVHLVLPVHAVLNLPLNVRKFLIIPQNTTIVFQDLF